MRGIITAALIAAVALGTVACGSGQHSAAPAGTVTVAAKPSHSYYWTRGYANAASYGAKNQFEHPQAGCETSWSLWSSTFTGNNVPIGQATDDFQAGWLAGCIAAQQ